MFSVKAMIEGTLDNLHNLLKHFIDRNDLRFYNVIIETNNYGKFIIKRDLESFYVEQEYFEDRMRFVKTYKFNNINEVLAFIYMFSNDIVLEFEIELILTDTKEIDSIIIELKTFSPSIIQITQEIVIYEEFNN